MKETILDTMTSGTERSVIKDSGRPAVINIQRIMIRKRQVSGLQIKTSTKEIAEVQQHEMEMKAERQFLRAQKLEAIGELSSGIAHDLNNTLFAVMGNLEMAQMDAVHNPNLKSLLDNAQAGLNRASDLIKQILNFSRQNNQETGPLKLQSVIHEVLKLSRSIVPSNIIITHALDENCGTVMASPSQIHQVMINLIINAYHAMEPDGGLLEVTLNAIQMIQNQPEAFLPFSGNYACLTVSDTGPGVDNALREKIFDPYFTTKKNGRGTGLGLSVARKIIQNHGGKIVVTNLKSRGACFHVYFPIVNYEAAMEKNTTGKTIDKN